MAPFRQALVFACLSAATLSAPGTARAVQSGRQRVDSLELRARTDSNDAVTHYSLAMAYWERKRFDEAERSLRQALALAPQYADAPLALAMLPEARGEGYWKKREKSEGKAAVSEVFHESVRYFRRAYLLNPLVELKLLGKAEAITSGFFVTGSGLVIRVMPWYAEELRKGVNEIRQGRHDRGFARLQKLYDDERAGTDAANLGETVLWYHGLAAAHLGRHETAIHDFALLTGRAVAREAERPEDAPPLAANDYRFILATMYFLGGRGDAALQTFRRALEFDLGLYQAHMQIARIHESGEQWDEAVSAWNAAIAINPDDPTLEIDLGASLARAGRLEEAAEQLNLAVERNPRDARAPYLLALVNRQLERPDAAKAAYRQFLAVAPSRFADQIAEARAHLAESPQ